MESIPETRGPSVDSADSTSSDSRSIEAMLAETTDRMLHMHRAQVHRDPWPDFSRFDTSAYDAELRRSAAAQWAGRARAEHGSVHQFTELTHALCEARFPLPVLGSLARLITDEVRHAELCAEMARTCFPEGLEAERRLFAWPTPRTPWEPAPLLQGSDDPEEAILRWAANAVLSACCLGETLSRPMLDAIAVVSTDPIATAVARQILRDEHFHATFGWEAMSILWPRLGRESKEIVQVSLARSLRGFENTTCGNVALEDLVDRELEIGPSDRPNLGTLRYEQYAMIFYATMEQEILPKLAAIGLDAERAWRERLQFPRRRRARST